jgi:hypothetical protein
MNADQAIFDIVHKLGEGDYPTMHIINMQDGDDLLQEIHYRIYHTDGYCFDIKRRECEEFEYIVDTYFEGFKPIRAVNFLLLLKSNLA